MTESTNKWLVKYLRQLTRSAIAPVAFAVDITRNQRQGDSCFRKDHLLLEDINLTPRMSFLQSRTRQSAIAFVSNRDLNRIFMHGGFKTKQFGSNHRVLSEVLRNTATDHK